MADEEEFASWGQPGTVESPGKTGFDAFVDRPVDPTVPWRCKYCGFSPNLDTLSEGCQNCGRDRDGEPGMIPARLERDPRLNYGRDAG